jgi:hypothetical protein
MALDAQAMMRAAENGRGCGMECRGIRREIHIRIHMIGSRGPIRSVAMQRVVSSVQ